jgi:hypothetical protein
VQNRSSCSQFVDGKNTDLFPAGSFQSCVPVRVRPLNEATFKSAVVDLLKSTSDTNLQRNYVGDGEGDY